MGSDQAEEELGGSDGGGRGVADGAALERTASRLALAVERTVEGGEALDEEVDRSGGMKVVLEVGEPPL